MPERPRKEGRLTVRISHDGKEAIAAIMEEEGRSESDVTRILLSEAIAARRSRKLAKVS